MRGADPERPRAGTQPGGEALVSAVARGDENAVTQLYDQYSDGVFRFVYRRVGECLEDAEEITLDTFLAAVSYAGTFDGTCTPFTWLCGIAKVRVADFLRYRQRRKRTPPGPLASLDDPDARVGTPAATNSQEAWDRFELRQVVERALAPLRPDEREVLVLRYVEQLSVQEIARLVGRSEKAAESLLMRAKKKAARNMVPAP